MRPEGYPSADGEGGVVEEQEELEARSPSSRFRNPVAIIFIAP